MQEDTAAKKPRPLRKRVAWVLVVVAVGLGACLGAVTAQKRLWAARALEAAIQDLRAIESAVMLWALNHDGKIPEQLASLTERRHCSRPPLRPDPWGNSYRYERPSGDEAKEFTVWSCGPDGVSGTTDDIVLSVPVRRELQELATE